MSSRVLSLSFALGLVAACSSAPEAPAPAPEAAAAEAAAPEAPADEVTPTPEEQFAGLKQSCEDAKDAMAARQAAKPLYERLGEEENIRAFTTKLYALHKANPAIGSLFAHVDETLFVQRVVEFMSSGTGGPHTYTGRDITTLHAHMGIGIPEFLAAGGDIQQAMSSTGIGDDEIQEVVCTLVSLSDQVITH